MDLTYTFCYCKLGSFVLSALTTDTAILEFSLRSFYACSGMYVLLMVQLYHYYYAIVFNFKCWKNKEFHAQVKVYCEISEMSQTLNRYLTNNHYIYRVLLE